jgi:hypothetical protein
MLQYGGVEVDETNAVQIGEGTFDQNFSNQIRFKIFRVLQEIA